MNAMTAAAMLVLLAASPPLARGQPPAPDSLPGPPLGVTGTVRFHGAFPSRFVAPRNVEVWLPPDYGADTSRRYPVLYAHDGQNAFSPATSYGGVDWAIDETMTRLIAERRIRPAIVVAIWNTPARMQEYLPKAALASEHDIPSGIDGIPPVQGPILSDDYLRFLVEELKPFIDRTYRTRPERPDTFIMGSSMGGLISAYAVAEYPRTFGGAACLSTHWPVADGAVAAWLGAHLPDPATHRFWFDHGTATLDASYGPYQARADSAFLAGGYVAGRNFASTVYPGAEHSERAWRLRVGEALEFLLGR